MIPSFIEREVSIDAPPETVWNIITQTEHIAQWFEADKVDVEWEAGATGSLTFSKHNHTVQVTVQTVDAPNLLAYRWEYPEGEDATPANSTLVEFALTPKDGGTLLRVTESGLRELDWTDEQKQTFLEGHERGWGSIVPALAEHAAKVAA